MGGLAARTRSRRAPLAAKIREDRGELDNRAADVSLDLDILRLSIWNSCVE